MFSYDAGGLTLRRLLGYFPTGLLWLLGILVVFGGSSPWEWLALARAKTGDLGLGVVLIVALFSTGAVFTPINFGFAVVYGSLFDALTSFGRSRSPRRWSTWLEENEVVSLITLGARRTRTKDWLTQHAAVRDMGAVSEGSAEWRIYKLLVMAQSPVFAQEILDLEAEANLYAGLALPLLVLGVLAVVSGQPLGLVFIVLGAVAPLRFQYARHREIDEIASAYVALFPRAAAPSV